MSTGAIKQKQTIPTSQKVGNSAKAKAWREGNVDYYAERNTMFNNVRVNLEKLYKVAAGFLDTSEYRYITHPEHTNPAGKGYPTQLRNYDIVTPMVNMLMGEKTQRKVQPSVVAVNSNIEDVKMDMFISEINRELEQLMVNTINDVNQEAGLQPSPVPSRPMRDMDGVRKEIDSIKDEKAITGSHALKYIFEAQDVNRKFRKGFYDILCTSFVFSIKDVRHNDVFYDTYSPANCGYFCSEDTDFIEDGEAAWIKRYMTLSDIIDEYGADLSAEDMKKLESYENTGSSSNSPVRLTDADILIERMQNKGFMNANHKRSYARNSLFEVAYVNWKSKVKVGKVTGTDIFGEDYEYDVDETYVALPEEKVEWRWVNQVWEGTRIKDEIYTRVRPIPFQRGKFDDPSACKLLINGRNLSGRHYYTKSPVEKVLAYQKIYNVIHWQLEKTINKNKEKITALPKAFIPDDEDMDMFDMMYYAEADGFLFLDEIDANKLADFQAVKVLDMSLSNYIAQLYEILNYVRLEAEETLGITRPRKGQTSVSEQVGTVERALAQSAVISEDLFVQYEEFEQRELQGLLDLSKFAWRDGKKKWFVDSNNRRILLDVLGSEYQELEFSVKAKGAGETKGKIDTLRERGLEMLQNGATPALIGKLMNTDNMEEIIDILDAESERILQSEQQGIQAEMDAKNAELEQKEKHHMDELEYKYYDTDAKVLMSQEQAASFDGNPENDIAREELQLKREELQVKREELATKLANPVPGEK